MRQSRTALGAWKALQAHAAQISSQHLRDLFATDPSRRFAQMSVCTLDLLYDFTRQRATPETLRLLISLAEACGLRERIDAFFSGEPVNHTERRAAMHMALRNRSERPMRADGQDVMPEVRAQLEKMREYVTGVHQGGVLGFTGARFTDVVNIGIGGSDLGIVMVTEALARYRNRGIRLHCVSNVDGVELADTLEEVNPATTLFVVCSKTFTTQETLANANAAREWLVGELGVKAVGHHFVAVSTNHQAMDAFGIAPESRFTMWDWVGGRYSLWSTVGLSIALALGMDQFELLLQGAHDMDEHFRSATFETNLPVLMGLVGVWNNDFLGLDSLAVLPYDRRLHRFPAYLQQLEMESNGKSVTRDGRPVDYRTGNVVWGEPGNNAQHSFFQMLHQGTVQAALDFIAPVNGSSRFARHQDLALANCFAQAEAFAFGQTADDVRRDLEAKGTTDSEIDRLVPHKVHAGNRPSSVIVLPRLGPRALGKLIAWYEHKVFVQSVVWDINPFDQWGVELGKKLASSMTEPVRTGAWQDGPPHVQALLAHVQRWRADPSA
ncbi:MAG TPA: glucose-6-phosphate isomerase [Steroidobacteraceae bacterium]|nr:glucose-6-phosphate isomerase [Steroidobacteraceae bacterium]